jgi:TrmH family RNA methyltransferase
MSRLIKSPRNQRVKDAVKLRHSRARKSRRRIVIDGAREVRRAFEAQVPVRELFVCEELLAGPEAADVVSLGEARGADILRVTSEVMAKLAYGDRAEGIVAVAATPRSTWPDWTLPDPPLVVVLEQIEKPGNLGGIVRTADAVGASAVLVAEPAADIYNPNAIRASLGTLFALPIAAASGDAILSWLRVRRFRIFAARVDAVTDYADADYRGASALVLGSEAAGLSALWQGDDMTSVALPLLGTADSLNVSVTAAVLMYEALRQRRTA